MFVKLSLFATMAITIMVPFTSALILDAPQNVVSAGPVTITWTSEAGDIEKFSTFSLFLINQAFNDRFAIANNVDPSPQSLSLTLPVVPARADYTLHATNNTNENDVYAASPSFPITLSSSSSLPSGSSNTATSPLSSVSSRSTSSQISTLVTTKSSTITTPTVSPTTTGTSASSANIPTASAFNAAPRRFNFNIGALSAAVMTIAGAVVLAL